jgi:DNA invertase Pin-like site-specific DNA recombinase
MKTAFSYTRFSTPDQGLGFSERRQLDKAKKWCEKHQLLLSEKSFIDPGVSAFNGKHLAKGAMGKLLAVVKSGEVILIEDATRWSRECATEALHRLREVVNRGVEVHFTGLNLIVSKENFEEEEDNLFGRIKHAREESKYKSERIAEGYADRRAALAAGRAVPLNRMPCWLEWQGDNQTGKPVVIETNAKVVRHIFKLATEGNGVKAIVRALKNTPPITTSKKPDRRWHATVVRRILSDKMVCGYNTMAEPPNPGVWPVVVDENIYCVAQEKLKFTKRQSRPAHSQVNLFTGLCKCARCDNNLVAHMSDNHGRQSRLVCGGASMGKTDCGFSSVPLELFEKSFLSFLADGDLVRPLLSTKPAGPSKLEELEGQLGEAQKLVKRLGRLMLGDADPSPTMVQQLKQQEKRAQDLTIDIDAERTRIKGETPALQSYTDFCERLADKAADPVYRPQLRRAISSIVERLVMDVRGHGDGLWVYTVELRDNSQPVPIIISDSGSWEYNSVRPAQYPLASEFEQGILQTRLFQTMGKEAFKKLFP